MVMQIFFISSVRKVRRTLLDRLNTYPKELIERGLEVSLPHGDTDSSLTDIELARKNKTYITRAAVDLEESVFA